MEYLIQGLPEYLHTSLIFAYITSYVAGVLISFTPCIYPVIPITVAFIGAHSSGSKIRGFILSIFYVLGMSLTYASLGAFAASTGKLFGNIQANPWVYFVIANVCIFMGLSLLDVFEFPSRVPGFITRVQPRKKGVLASFLVGALSGLATGPCTTPVLAVLLGYVATTQNITYGMSLLFVFAFGMGSLLIAIGTFAGLLANIPKSGMWMTRIHHISGWILIGAGEYFLIKAGSLWI